LYRAIRKYSIENFTFEILEEGPPETLNDLEVKYILEYKSYDQKYGYNKTLGGSCHIVFSEDTLEKMSLLKKGIPKSEEHKRAVSAAKKGIKHSKEHCKKISEALTGKKQPEDIRLKISQAMKDNPKLVRSADTKNKLAKANQGIHRYTNGVINIRRFECPEGFWPGVTKKK